MSNFMRLQQMGQNFFTPSVTIPEELKNKEQPLPKYLCKSCTKCEENRCTFYNRPIIKDYNRCFNHSNYHPVASKYVSPVNIEDIALEEENKLSA